MTKRGQPPDDPSSAPESGTVRETTCGNQTTKQRNSADPDQRPPRTPTDRDEPSQAQEEG